MITRRGLLTGTAAVAVCSTLPARSADNWPQFWANYTGKPDSFTGPLDGLESTPVGAWHSTYRLTGNYKGPLIRLRRVSGGAEKDFTWANPSIGLLDDAAIQAWEGGSSSQIVTVYDQIGSNDWTQATAGEQPFYSTAWAAGVGTQFFDGSGDRMDNDGLAQYFGGTDTPFTMFLVAEHDGGTSDAFFGAGAAAVSNASVHFEVKVDSTWRYFRRADDGTTADLSAGTVDADKHVHVLRQSPTTFDQWIDTTQLHTAAAANVNDITVTSVRWGIGWLTGAETRNFDGWMPCMVLFDSAISDADVATLEAALGTQMGV